MRRARTGSAGKMLLKGLPAAGLAEVRITFGTIIRAGCGDGL